MFILPTRCSCLAIKKCRGKSSKWSFYNSITTSLDRNCMTLPWKTGKQSRLALLTWIRGDCFPGETSRKKIEIKWKHANLNISVKRDMLTNYDGGRGSPAFTSQHILSKSRQQRTDYEMALKGYLEEMSMFFNTFLDLLRKWSFRADNCGVCAVYFRLPAVAVKIKNAEHGRNANSNVKHLYSIP